MTQPSYELAELAALRDHLFGPSNDIHTTEGNFVPMEGTVVDPARLSADDYFRDFVKRMFDPDYDQLEPQLPQPEDPQ